MNIRKRAGTVLLRVIVIGAILLTLATVMIRWKLHCHLQAARALSLIQLTGATAKLRDSINTCLYGAGYPSGSCTPNAAQADCIPGGAIAVFGGTPPACSVKITAVN